MVTKRTWLSHRSNASWEATNYCDRAIKSAILAIIDLFGGAQLASVINWMFPNKWTYWTQHQKLMLLHTIQAKMHISLNNSMDNYSLISVSFVSVYYLHKNIYIYIDIYCYRVSYTMAVMRAWIKHRSLYTMQVLIIQSSITWYIRMSTANRVSGWNVNANETIAIARPCVVQANLQISKTKALWLERTPYIARIIYLYYQKLHRHRRYYVIKLQPGLLLQKERRQIPSISSTYVYCSKHIYNDNDT